MILVSPRNPRTSASLVSFIRHAVPAGVGFPKLAPFFLPPVTIAAGDNPPPPANDNSQPFDAATGTTGMQ